MCTCHHISQEAALLPFSFPTFEVCNFEVFREISLQKLSRIQACAITSICLVGETKDLTVMEIMKRTGKRFEDYLPGLEKATVLRRPYRGLAKSSRNAELVKRYERVEGLVHEGL
jgi:hypothetical protein